MSEELEISPPADEGLSAEPESQESSPTEAQAPVAEIQPPVQTIQQPKKAAVVEPSVSQPTSNGKSGRLPSHFYNQRKTNEINSRFDALEKRIESYFNRNPNNPPIPTVQAPNAQQSDDELKKKYWTDPYSGTRHLVSEELKAFQEKIKQDIVGDFEKREQEKRFNDHLQEADRLVLTNERTKTNPHFKDDIIAIFKKYKGLQYLAVKDPVGAATEAFELYDELIKRETPNTPTPKKGQMSSTQTTVRANGSNSEEALLAELKQITDGLTPLNANDPKIVKRMDEINVALDQLNQG